MENVNETTSLIAGSKVTGTAVYDMGGEELGSIHDIMIDKLTGKVAYAVMSFGGFLGMGNSYHPLPWSLLKYDVDKSGYVVNLSRDQLQGAPSYAVGTDPGWGDRGYEQKVHDFYDADAYWGAMV